MTKKTDRKTSRVEGIIEDIIGKSPHSKEIITAFKPLFLVRERLIDELHLKAADRSSIDGEKLRQGIPCINQTPFYFKSDPWEKIGCAVLSAIRQGFPALGEDAAKLEGKIKAGDIRLFDAFTDFPGSVETAVGRWSNEADIKPDAIELMLSAVTRIVLQARSNGIGGHIEGMGWEKGTCPVCGAHPTIAVIREKIAQRWLHCSRCGHEWRFSRMFCPGCEQESPSGLDYFYVDDRKQETAFTCDACKRYLITLNHVSDLGDYDRDVSAMGLIHLDLIMQEKGFAPMSRCEWNTF
ncbi:MAG: formate dehydrogenase accessory protein FdhE [Syntrophaceae bacterium PtaB.Bin038]|nr:MAG: formate dehydrogenase accessory protein FdhE [Syntrophaceae bacterium PtaB.Bin038]